MAQQNVTDLFRQEAQDLLARIEEIALDINPDEPGVDAINDLFRAFHTIKGSGGMVGFDLVAAFTHHVETALDHVREGRLALSPQLVELVLLSSDHLKILLRDEQETDADVMLAGERITAALQALEQPLSPHALAPQAQQDTSVPQGAWHVRFRPHPEILIRGTNPLLLLDELRQMGACGMIAHHDAIPSLDELSPDHCYLWWEFTVPAGVTANAIKDVFIFVDDSLELTIGETIAEAGPARPLAEAAPASGDKLKGLPAARKTAAAESTVKVPSEKLDRLVNLVGELVMNQSRLTQAAAHVDLATISVPAEELERLVAELRDCVLGIRMMPIGTTFSRFKRLVHDLSGELGKEIDLVTSGEETELDKTVLDQLGDPLVHLIRNSIGHGVEPPDQRVAASKPRRGTIRLTASHMGSNVVVAIQDDGRGMNPSAIRAKAVEKGLIADEASLSEKEILNLIFLPGFSTAEQVTNVSGRGVGMDVVKRQIDALRGSVAISTQPGAGTSISLTLPLTLAIIDGLLVEIGGDQFIVPMSVVTENVELNRTQRASNNGRNVVAVRGDLVPYIRLREVFGIGGQEHEIEKIVIVRYEEQRVGLVVDRVLGSHQTVIQSLGSFYRNIDLVSGATIMGDGRVALIVDVAGLVRFADLRSRVEMAA
jgi:two-component system chemotaxis sensor kinase CheA